MKKILNMLPFLESEDLLELAKECLAGTVDICLEEVLPFMDDKDVDKLFEDYLNEGGELTNAKNVNLSNMLPFLSQKAVDSLFLSQANEKINCDALPFVSDEALHKLVLKYAENPDLDVDVDELYPFLSDKDISLLFKAYLKNHKKAKNDSPLVVITDD